MVNDVILNNYLDENLRPIKIGGEVSSLELSTDNARLNGLELQGDLIGGKYKLYNDGSYTYLKTDSYFNLETANTINIKAGGIGTDIYSSGTYKTASFLKNPADTSIFYMYPASESLMMDYFAIEVYADAVSKIKTHREDPFGGSEETDAHLTLDIDGDIILDPHSGITKFYDAGDTDDYFKITVVGGTGATTLETVSDAADGHLTIVADGRCEFDGCAVGFDLVTPTYNATDTDVDFQTGNKQFVTFGSGNITDLNLIFPRTSGNFTLLLKQDGTGSRTVTNYKVWDQADDAAASGSATVKFAGGSNPTLTTDANHVDIISFFYDGDTQIAYGVPSLDFQF